MRLFFLNQAIKRIPESWLTKFGDFFGTLKFRRIICLQNTQTGAELMF